MADYQQALVELGFLHHRLLRGTAPDDWQERGAEHVERIRAVRPHVAFPGQVVPPDEHSRPGSPKQRPSADDDAGW